MIVGSGLCIFTLLAIMVHRHIGHIHHQGDGDVIARGRDKLEASQNGGNLP